jgi:hypothetical protein
MTNNTAEAELQAVAVGRRNRTFAGSDEGGRRAAALYTLIATASSPMCWQRCWTIQRNGSATFYRGIGTQNAVPRPDTWR